MSDFPYRLTVHAQERIAQRRIVLEWISRTLQNPQKLEPDPLKPNLTQAYREIPEYNNNVLKVVYDSNESPWLIITAHFERKYKGKLWI